MQASADLDLFATPVIPRFFCQQLQTVGQAFVRIVDVLQVATCPAIHCSFERHLQRLEDPAPELILSPCMDWNWHDMLWKEVQICDMLGICATQKERERERERELQSDFENSWGLARQSPDC